MAFSWLYFGNETGQGLRSALTELENRRNELFNPQLSLYGVRDKMIQMRSGDGSDPVHYAEVTSRYSFVDNASAKAAFDEIASACGVLQNSSSTATTINAALSQLFARLRG